MSSCQHTPLVSIVVPCFQSSQWLAQLTSEVKQAMTEAGFSYELILVNDCSPDDTWHTIQDIAANDDNVRGIDLVFNTGQYRSTLCGLLQTQGEIIVTTDDDLQQPPRELPKLIQMLLDNDATDCVIAAFGNKKHNLLRNLGTGIMDLLFRVIYKKPRGIRSTSMRAMRRPLVTAISEYSTINPNINALIFQTTNRIKSVSVEHQERVAGKSGYGILRLLTLLIDNVVSVSTLPLKCISMVGFLAAFASFILGVFYVLQYFFTENIAADTGFMTQVLLIIFFGGTTLFAIGLLGEYIIRILEEVRGRPRFVIRQATNVESQNDSAAEA
ncbi:MAG: glycosyltransferase [Pirellulales bacterium]|jgi:glycosyltransferase involved in cell wall biosynthesis